MACGWENAAWAKGGRWALQTLRADTGKGLQGSAMQQRGDTDLMWAKTCTAQQQDWAEFWEGGPALWPCPHCPGTGRSSCRSLGKGPTGLGVPWADWGLALLPLSLWRAPSGSEDLAEPHQPLLTGFKVRWRSITHLKGKDRMKNLTSLYNHTSLVRVKVRAKSCCLTTSHSGKCSGRDIFHWLPIAGTRQRLQHQVSTAAPPTNPAAVMEAVMQSTKVTWYAQEPSERQRLSRYCRGKLRIALSSLGFAWRVFFQY